jgi:Na+/melibiose symporter-like transporter
MTDLHQSLRFSIAMDVASFTSIRGAFFGVGFMLYCMCVQIFVDDFQKRQRPQRQTAFSFAYCTLIVSSALSSLVISTDIVVSAFLKHGDSLQATLADIMTQ